jgi:hypothetical protein
MTLSVQSASPTSNLGFLTILNEPAGTLGGYLITNSWGRPLEFRLTSPVQPNRVQHILYGPALESYVCGDLIGKTLVEKSTTPVQWLITDHPAAVALRQRLTIPVSLWSLAEPTADNLLVAARNLYCDDQFPGDVPAIEKLLGKLGNLDLGEPFQRIRDAIHEARKMGVGKSSAPLAA